MASTINPSAVQSAADAAPQSRLPGLALVALGVLGALTLSGWVGVLPLIVAAVLTGAVIGNVGLATAEAAPGLGFAATTILRLGIVMLGLRLSVGQVADLGVEVLAIVTVTVIATFFGVQFIGRRMGLTAGLSLLVASGFSICGNSAIASVKGVSHPDDEEVAAAIGLVTLCGTAAILTLPALGAAFGLTDTQLGVWTGASVQDTAQVIAVSSAAGPAVLAVATAVKLTRVLFLAPIVGGLSMRSRSKGETVSGARPPLVPRFVVGFVAAMFVRSSGVTPAVVLDFGREVERYALAAGMVGLGSSVRLASLRTLGFKPFLLGAAAWIMVGAVSLGAIQAFQLA